MMWLRGEACALLVAIGLVDYATGYEVTIFPFYSIPILFILWTGGTVRDAVLLAGFSSVSWWWADAASGHVYSREWLRIWDAATRMMFFSLVVYAGATIRKQSDADRAKIEILERARKLEQEIINISERERRRIGRDLHDGLGQQLVAIGFAAESLKEAVESESPTAAKAAGQFAELLRDAVAQVRGLARGLSPVDHDVGGLECSLEELVASVTRFSGIPCAFRAEGAAKVGSEVAAHLFRIAQEALNNAVKHSKATELEVELKARRGGLVLSVRDNGSGFPAVDAPERGMGLNIMRYRARILGGELAIEHLGGRGTRVVCKLDSDVVSLQRQNGEGHE